MSLFIFNKDSGWQPRFARQPFCTRKNHQKIYKSLKKLFPSKKGDLKKKLTCWGIEPRLYEMHEFLQADFCKFLPVAFATKNLARALMLGVWCRVRVRFPDATIFLSFFYNTEN